VLIICFCFYDHRLLSTPGFKWHNFVRCSILSTKTKTEWKIGGCLIERLVVKLCEQWLIFLTHYNHELQCKTYIPLSIQVFGSRMVLFASQMALLISLISITWLLFWFRFKLLVLFESGALQDVLHLHDVLARVSLARLCHTISRARALDGKMQFAFLTNFEGKILN